VHKRIPVGAGLGGGSADAAAVLRWAGITDAASAASIGADVAFCLAGGRARVRGIGEIIEPLPYVSEQYTLLLAPVGCDTAAVYAAWDELGGPAGEHPAAGEPRTAAGKAGGNRHHDRCSEPNPWLHFHRQPPEASTSGTAARHGRDPCCVPPARPAPCRSPTKRGCTPGPSTASPTWSARRRPRDPSAARGSDPG